jgi:phosphoglycolate phosphatase
MRSILGSGWRMDSQNPESEMVASWMAFTKAFLFDFDGTLARLSIDFQALRLEILALAQDFGLKEPILQDPPYLLELAGALSAELAIREPGQAAVFLNRSMALIEAREWQAASPENLFPYTPRVLAGLLQENYQIAILTRNSGASVRQVFPDIDRYCHLFLPREAVPRPKPDPGHLLEALHRFQVPARKAVMVGDHPLDILSGKKTGTRTIGVLTGRTGAAELEAAQADMVLSDVAELLDLLV